MLRKIKESIQPGQALAGFWAHFSPQRRRRLSLLLGLGLLLSLAWPVYAAITLNTVDSPGNVGQHTSLALDAAGNPVISYYDVTNQDLKLAYCSDQFCANPVFPQTLDFADDVGQFTSLALDTNGNPVISYFKNIPGEVLKVAICDSPICLAPTIQTVDPSATNVVGEFTSLALRQPGNIPIISYYDATAGDLKLAICGDATCTTVQRFVLDGDLGDIVGQYTSLALNAAGSPVISYYDVTNGDLKLFICGDANCSVGNTKIPVDTTGDVGRFTSLALRQPGNIPVISYYDVTNGDLKAAVCGNAACTTLAARVVVDDGPGLDVGQFTSLKLRGVSGYIISYRNVTNVSVRLIHCVNDSCTNFFRKAADDTANVGQFTSLALRGGLSPVISYYDVTNGNLKLSVDVITPVHVPLLVRKP